MMNCNLFFYFESLFLQHKQQFMLIMFGSSPAKAAATPHFKANARNIFASRSKKTCSIPHFKPFSPSKILNNPQQKKGREASKSIKQAPLNVKPHTAAITHANQSGIIQSQDKKSMGRMSQNLSFNGIRTTFSPVPFARRDRQVIKAKQNNQSNKTSTDQGFFEIKKHPVKPKDEKKCKQAPSFIKNKAHHSLVTLQDFKTIKMLIEEDSYKQFIAEHKKTSAWFTIKAYKKSSILQDRQLCEQLKFYIKNLEINHNLIVKCFGYFVDAQNIYLIEEYLAGETISESMSKRQEPLNQQEIGSKICEILTAITYLHSIHFCHGAINQANTVNSLNICKLKRPQLISQKKDILFDIWCIGKLTFEMVTSCKLIDDKLLDECHNIEDIFNSSQVVLALQFGFKRFQGGNFSRDLIKFLITTLWEIQNKSLTLEQIWQLQYMKIYKEQDIWTCQGEK